MMTARWYAWRAPMTQPLRFGTREVRTREGRLVAVSDGTCTGWGEVSPLPGFRMAPLVVLDRVVGSVLWPTLARCAAPSAPRDVQGVLDALPEVPGDLGGALSAALCDLAARRTGVPMWQWLGGRSGRVSSNGLGGLLGPGAAERAAALVAAGYDTIKWKVPTPAGTACVLRPLRAAYPDVRWRLDANGAWSRQAARSALSTLTDMGVEYIEQPLAPGEEAALTTLAAYGVPLALDESLLDAATLRAAIAHPGVSAVVLKPATLGGPLRAGRWARRALDAGRGVTITSFIDSAVGRAHAAHLAAAVAPGGRHGLDTGSWLSRDVGVVPSDGTPSAELGDAPGIGIDPDVERIEALT